jgi:hypothetical protein
MNDLVRPIVRSISAVSPRAAHFVISSKASFVDPHGHCPGRTMTVSPTWAVLELGGSDGGFPGGEELPPEWAGVDGSRAGVGGEFLRDTTMNARNHRPAKPPRSTSTPCHRSLAAEADSRPATAEVQRHRSLGAEAEPHPARAVAQRIGSTASSATNQHRGSLAHIRTGRRAVRTGRPSRAQTESPNRSG